MSKGYMNVDRSLRKCLRRYHVNGLRRKITLVMRSVAFSVLTLTVTGCFTGIESTKKITLTREDRKALAPTPEETFMDTIKSLPLGKWDVGKAFFVADDKSRLAYDNVSTPSLRGMTPSAGDTLIYEGTGTKTLPDGTTATTLYFHCNGERYTYNTGKTPDRAMTEVKSESMPMIIDLDMVSQARELLTGLRVWTRTPLRYDSAGNRSNGLKYTQVEIKKIEPGDMVFPLNLEVADSTGIPQWIKINFGNTGKESRSFANLFYLNDIRERYPHISESNWQLIRRGRVANGMTKEECRLSLGAPADVDKGHDWSQTLDLWKYNNGIVLYFEDGLLVNHK